MTHPGKLTNPRPFIERALDVMNKSWHINQQAGRLVVSPSLWQNRIDVFVWDGEKCSQFMGIYADGTPGGDTFAAVNERLDELMEQYK